MFYIHFVYFYFFLFLSSSVRSSSVGICRNCLRSWYGGVEIQIGFTRRRRRRGFFFYILLACFLLI